MSQPTYTYSTGINNSVAAEMMDANTRIKSELDTMHADLQASLSAWQSPSSKPQYEARKRRWDAAANAMPQSLQVASQTLQNITTRMNNTETAITDSWS
ncbi:WXG100 family type VII secretion target [Lentzea alba]|uniref:WXG100 family type VII secretion target n=1 Tax=Lentzea alba TaxID=2714351 RepID=UPI0039BF2BBA